MVNEKDIFEQLWAKCNSGVGCDADMRDMLIMYRALKLQSNEKIKTLEEIAKEYLDIVIEKDSKIEKLNYDIKHYKDDFDEMNLFNNSLIKDKEQLQKENEDLKNLLDGGSNNNTLLRKRIDEANYAIDVLTKENDSLKNEIKTLNDTMELIE